jgi:hypothetical protein
MVVFISVEDVQGLMSISIYPFFATTGGTSTLQSGYGDVMSCFSTAAALSSCV